MLDVRRREFITLLGGAVAGWPLGARAQSTTKRASLGYLSGTFETEAKPFIGIFLEGLRLRGYIEGRDFDIAYQFAEGKYDQLGPLAQQIIDLKPDVIITPTGDVAALAIRLGAEAVIVLQDGMLVTQRRRIVALASTARLPDIHSVRDAVIAGGFLCYGINLRENFLRAAGLVAKILMGEAAADLPVEFPTKLDLVINAKTAKALGLEVPPTLLARADEVIE